MVQKCVLQILSVGRHRASLCSCGFLTGVFTRVNMQAGIHGGQPFCDRIGHIESKVLLAPELGVQKSDKSKGFKPPKHHGPGQQNATAIAKACQFHRGGPGDFYKGTRG